MMSATLEIMTQLFRDGQTPKPLNFVNTVSNAACFYLAQHLSLQARSNFVCNRYFAFESVLQLAALDLAMGTVRWLDGPHAGRTMMILAADASGLVLDEPLSPTLTSGLRCLVREGCDHRLDTCATRFANAVNFQGEPFLPGNDQIYRYPPPPQ